jgi:hypothetical protein
VRLDAVSNSAFARLDVGAEALDVRRAGLDDSPLLRQCARSRQHERGGGDHGVFRRFHVNSPCSADFNACSGHTLFGANFLDDDADRMDDFLFQARLAILDYIVLASRLFS